MNQFHQGIPDGITREDVEQAIRDFEAGAEHDFGPSTFYDLIYEDNRYPPKAILGLAARRLADRVLEPHEFEGGETSKCFKVLRELDFQIVPKEKNVSDTPSNQEAVQAFENMLPDADQRAGVARLFAKAISVAHPINAGCWVLTYDQQRGAITLDVGRVFALSLKSDGLSVLFDEELLAEINGDLPNWEQREPAERFASLPTASWRQAPIDEIFRWWDRLEDPHLSAVRLAAEQLKRSVWARHNRPELVLAVAETSGEDVPQPEYGAMTLRKKRELKSLFAEFLEAYPRNKGWQFHLDVIPSSRDLVRASVESIRGRAESGEDVTDRALTELLPHADSTRNRERGAWISVAPVINGDIKTWFENAGWAKAEDWPQIAQLILEFLTECTDDPTQLDAACERLAEALPCKGIQAAILSPALNALRPDDFIIFNKKSRLTVNYFADSKYTTNLADYPAANSTELGIIDEIAELLDSADILEGLYRTDRFDMFCHWLVAVKKYAFNGVHCWKIAPGEGAWNWEACRDNGYIAIGWDELGDLGVMSEEQFAARNKELAAKIDDWSEDGAKQAWAFAHRITEGDRIVANKGTTEVLGIGTVVGPYQFVEGVRHGHQIPVDWEDIELREVQQGGWRRTLIELSKNQFDQIVSGEPGGQGGVSEPDGPDYGERSRFWWVNQGDSWRVASDGGYVWAPLLTESGRRLQHHKNVAKLKPDDTVLHYANGSLRAIGTVSERPTQALHPETPDRGEGHMASIQYSLLESPIPLEDIPDDLRRSGEEPFTRSGSVKQGYMFTLSELFVRRLKGALGDRLPLDVIPADEENRFWLFQANVNKYPLERELQRLGPGGMETWMVSTHWKEIRPGDLVALWQSGKMAGIYGIAEAAGEVIESEMPDWSHDPEQTKVGWQVPVRVLSVLEEPVLKTEALDDPALSDLAVIRAPQRTNYRVTKEQWDALQAILAKREPVANEEVSLGTVSEQTGIPEETLSFWVDAIHRKGQGVLYGPPGTGKTFVAEHLAHHIVGGGDGFVDLVQFHPAYTYEDFIQGLRPESREDGSLDYRLMPGRFLEFCRKAAGREAECVLIIDEINRANLSRVFGELMYLLEYREKEVPLAGGERLQIPQNVRLIGTMNTADRSIALVDHALRRRFAFIALYPQYEVLDKFQNERGYDASNLTDLLKRVNRAIDDPHYEVGISFFLKEDLTDHLGAIWRMEVEPYLEEYFFDQPSKVDEFRWENIAEKVL